MTEPVTELTNAVLAFVPRLVGTLLTLIIGWLIGSIAARLTTRVADRVEVDKTVLTTPVGKILGGTEKTVSGAFGTLGRQFVYTIAVFTVANVLAVDLSSRQVSAAAPHAPSFVAGLLVIVLGFVVAGFIGDAITRTHTATETPYTSVFAVGTRMFLYFTTAVIGLSTMGTDVTILFTIAQAFVWGIATALAVDVGGAIAFGTCDYVPANVERQMGSTHSVATTPVSPMGGDADSPGGMSPTDDQPQSPDISEYLSHLLVGIFGPSKLSEAYYPQLKYLDKPKISGI